MQDINMMDLGGCERTEKMWASLLDSAGPKPNFVVVEGRLKEA
jgi:hypothetical protein